SRLFGHAHGVLVFDQVRTGSIRAAALGVAKIAGTQVSAGAIRVAHAAAAVTGLVAVGLSLARPLGGHAVDAAGIVVGIDAGALVIFGAAAVLDAAIVTARGRQRFAVRIEHAAATMT